MRKIILIFAIAFFLAGAVSAETLKESFDGLIGKNCNIIDYGNYDSAALKNKFGLSTNVNSDCAVLVDFYPFEQNTKDIFMIVGDKLGFSRASVSYGFNSNGLVKYIGLIADDSSSLGNLIANVLSYESKQDLFSDSTLILSNSGKKAESIKPSCTPSKSSNIFSVSDYSGFKSSCLNEDELLHLKCANGNFEFSIQSRANGCTNNKCNLENDENKDDKYNLIELFKVLKKYVSGESKDLAVNVANFWANN